jgi:hypothetical protein
LRDSRVLILLAGLVAVVAAPDASQAYTLTGRWSPTTSASYPVVPAVSCPNQFALNFSQPWPVIRRQALSAANEWFTSGGADLRIRVRGDLPDTDPRCQTSGAAGPNLGEIVITAEPNNGGGQCFLATTFWWLNGSSVARAKVIMHSGTACSGSYQPYPWAASGEYPGSSEYDFWSVFLHEFGHALGFNHSSDGNAVMWPSASMGDAQKRFLSSDERAGLRDAALGYPRIQTQSQHRRSVDNGATWHSEGEPFGLSVIGGPAVCARDNVPSGSLYLVASTRADNDTLHTYRTNGVAFGDVRTSTVGTHLPPGAACGDSRYLVATVDTTTDQAIYTQWSSGATTWSTPTSTGYATGLPPALAHASWNGYFVLAFADRWSGKLRTLISRDNGSTFADYQEWNTLRAASPLGLTCQASGGYCTLTYADGDLSHTPLRSAAFYFDAVGRLWLHSTEQLGYHSYGGAVASNPNRFEFVWRDRGTATILTAGGWPWAPTLDTLGWSGDVIHAAPRLAWGFPWAEWSAWYSFASRYNQ